MTYPTPAEEPVEEVPPTRRSESRETADTAVAMEDEVPAEDGEDGEDGARSVEKQQQRDKRTRFEMDERRSAGATALTDTMTSDGTFVPVLEEDNQAGHRTTDLRYQMMERKIERLEKRLEAYEVLQRRQAKTKVQDTSACSGGGAASDMQHIEFFLTEMDKQNAVIAQMRANQRVLEQKLDESMRKTHRFHHDQLERMTKFQEVVQIMNSEFVRGAMLRDEEKMLEKNSHDKKTKAVRRALDEQLQDLKHETSHQRRRLEIKFEKKIVELATENQLLRTENLELRDELNRIGSATRSNKRTVRILSDEVIKLKRAVGAPPNPEIEEVLRVSGHRPATSTVEVHPTT